MKYVEFCNDIRELLFKKKDVIAAVIIGSYARLCPKKNSDVDIIIVAKNNRNKNLISFDMQKIAMRYGVSFDILWSVEKDFTTAIEKCDPLMVGMYCAYDTIIGHEYIEQQINIIKEAIERRNISLVVGEKLWTTKDLLN